MNRLRELREDHDLTLAAVGEVIGATATAVGRYETEKRALTAELIQKFCAFYGVTADYLLGLSAWKAPAVSKTDTALLSAYHAAPPEIRNIVDAALEPYKARASADSAAS